ncbi:hypothetical protein LZ32DRAFT_213828 [Colletotrichum eremochloae]|nr:hypothetical protein LZ32DRAFT_213828 [Colletotrichum eremochloae]
MMAAPPLNISISSSVGEIEDDFITSSAVETRCLGDRGSNRHSMPAACNDCGQNLGLSQATRFAGAALGVPPAPKQYSRGRNLCWSGRLIHCICPHARRTCGNSIVGRLLALQKQ